MVLIATKIGSFTGVGITLVVLDAILMLLFVFVGLLPLWIPVALIILSGALGAIAVAFMMNRG